MHTVSDLWEPKSVFLKCVLQNENRESLLDAVLDGDCLSLVCMHRIDVCCSYSVYPKWGLRPKNLVAQFFLGKYLQILGGDSNSPHF